MGQRAVVVGAGIGGLCAAVGLRSAGWDVLVVERWPAVVAVGAGLGVWPDAQEALDRLGVGDAFRERAVDFGDAALFTADGRRLARLPRRRVERRGGRPIRILPRTEVMAFLTDAAESCRILTGIDIADRPDLLSDADVIVGADGLRSRVRRTYFPEEAAAPRYSGVVAWRGSVPFELDPAQYGETWDDGALFGLTRLAPGRTNWYAAVRTPPDDTSTTTFADVRRRVESWRRPIPDVLGAADPDAVLRHPVWDLEPHLTTYVTDRVALIGDAAHAMTPNLGRGACEAVLDADDLVARLSTGAPVAAALAEYDRHRRPPTRSAVSRSRAALAIATTRHRTLRNAAVRLISPTLQ